MSRSLAAVCLTCLVLVSPSLYAQKRNAISSFSFGLKVAGISDVPFFKSVGGLSSETDVTEFREGGVNAPPRKIAGATKYSNIVLKRGITGDTSLAVWRKIVEDGHFDQARRTGFIVLYDKQNREIARWSIVNAWPSAIAVEADPDTGDPMEVITLAVDSSQRQ